MGSGVISKPLEEWTPDQVADAVCSIGTSYEVYKDSLLANGCDGMTLKTLSEEEIMECLVDMGVDKLMHRKNMCTKLLQLQSSCASDNNFERKSGDIRPASSATSIVNKINQISFCVPSEFQIPEEVSWAPREVMTNMFQIQGIALDPKDIDPALQKVQNAIETKSEGYCSDGVTSYDVFLSYRVATDADLAEKIYLNLKLAGLHPFLDKKCLVDGMPWRDGFLKGLTNSRKFVAIISSAGLKAVRNPYINHTNDNVLLEYQTALQISSHIEDASYVIPLFIGEYTDGMLKKFGDYNAALYPNDVFCQPNPVLVPELIEAFEEQDVNRVNKLITENVDVNFKFDDENNETVLMKAVSHLNQDDMKTKSIVTALLDTGSVDIAAETLDGHSVIYYLKQTYFIHYCICNCDRDGIDLMLRLGVKIDDFDEDNGEVSLLASALEHNVNIDFIQWLIKEKGASTVQPLKTVLHNFLPGDEEEFSRLQMLLALTREEDKSPAILGPIMQESPGYPMQVAQSRDKKGVDFCLALGLDINHIFKESKESLLSIACKYEVDEDTMADTLSFITWLVEDKHAKVESTSTSRYSPLLAAAERLTMEIAETSKIVTVLLNNLDGAAVVNRHQCDYSDYCLDNIVKNTSYISDCLDQCSHAGLNLLLRLGFHIDDYNEDDGEVSILAYAVKCTKNSEFVNWLMTEHRASPRTVVPFLLEWLRNEGFDEDEFHAFRKCVDVMMSHASLTGYSPNMDELLKERVLGDEYAMEWLNDTEEEEEEEFKNFLRNDIFATLL